jgi:hypothetical protein
MTRQRLALSFLVVSGALLMAGGVYAAPASLFDLPVLKLENLPAGGQSLSLSLQTLILMSALTILPSTNTTQSGARWYCPLSHTFHHDANIQRSE